MKNKYIYLTILSVLGLISCEFDQELEDTPVPVQESGEADFSTFVSVGASITAGFADGALYIDGQEVGFPNLLASQMKAAGGGEFSIPLMQDNIGGFAGVFETELDDEGNQVPVFGTRLVLSGNPTGNDAAPVRSNNNEPQNDINTLISGLYNNIGVPGAKSFHGTFSGYAAANPYFGRMATTPDATMIGDAVAQNPTFFSLWLGANDVLSFATSGGTGIDQFVAGNDDPTTYGNDDITSANVFGATVSAALDALTANGADGVLFNIPFVTDLPFFTTVPYNPIPLDETTAAGINLSYSAYNQGLLQAQAAINAGALEPLLSPGDLSDEEIVRRTINFTAGQNAVVIFDESLTDLTAIDPALVNLRQTTENDLIVLTASSFIGTQEIEGDPTTTNGIAIPLGDEWVLTPEEQEEVETATIAFNTTLDNLAATNENIMVFNANSLLTELSTTGLNFEGGTIFSALGSGFSLDGIHLSPRGNAVLTNAVIDNINSFFGATLQPVIPINFGTVTLE